MIKEKADKIIYGNIVTIDGDNVVEAVAIKDGKILALSSKDEINNYKSNSTVIDEYANTNYIYPGFIDTHTQVR